MWSTSEFGIVTTACSNVPYHRSQIPSKQRIWRILFPQQGDFGLADRFWLMRMLNTTENPNLPSGNIHCIFVTTTTSAAAFREESSNVPGDRSMNIRFISTLTAEDENHFAPALLKAVGSLLDQLPIAYTVRIETTGAQVFQHSHPAFDNPYHGEPAPAGFNDGAPSAFTEPVVPVLKS